MNQTLDNIFWQTLSGPHAKYAVGTDYARRYAPGFSPILAFRERENPNFASMLPYCEPGELLYCDGWSGRAPEGWEIAAQSTMFRMVCSSPALARDVADDAVPLGAEHAQRALELAALTRPGPFGPRTIELGEYLGYFEGTRLIAMAGERMCADGLREISGVCTHPEFQGCGLARRLVATLVRRQTQRRETPFLHVMHDNVAAHGLYQRLGFTDYLESVVRVVSRR